MQNVNGWLMALAFLLGLVLTLFLLIHRVKREVPEYASLGAGAGVRVLAAHPEPVRVAARQGGAQQLGPFRPVPREQDGDVQQPGLFLAPRFQRVQ